MSRRARFWERDASESTSLWSRRVLALVGTSIVHGVLVAVLLMPVEPMQPRERPVVSSVQTPDSLLISSVSLSGQRDSTEASASAASRKEIVSRASPATLRLNRPAVRAAPQTEARSLLTEGRAEQARIGELSRGEQQAADQSDPVQSAAPAMLAGVPTSLPASGTGTQTASLAKGNGTGAQGDRRGDGAGAGKGGRGAGSPLLANCRRVPYPEMAKARGWQGQVEIEVKLDNQGELLSADVARSSGHKLLDRVALEWARRCEYTAPPIDSGSEAVAYVPVSFRLRGVSAGEFMVKLK
jgi:TonB family protein